MGLDVDPSDPYAPGHVDDPVTAEAVKDAMAATDKKAQPRRAWFDKFITALIVMIMIVGPAGIILGSVNAVELHTTQDQLKEAQQQLKNQQACILKLNAEEQQADAVRAQIADDDRVAVDNIINSVFSAKTKQEVEQDYKNYVTERALNDKKRSEDEISIPSLTGCVLIPVKSTSVKSTPSSVPSSVKPSTTPAKKTAGATTSPKVSSAPGKATSTPVSLPQPTVGELSTAPKPSLQPSKPVASTSPTAPPKTTPTPEPSQASPTPLLSEVTKVLCNLGVCVTVPILP